MELPRYVFLVYGSLSLFQSMLQNIFLLYHMETYVTVYRIDQRAFWFCEVIFLVWNSVNDPLFGWLSDRAYLRATSSSSTRIVRKRIASLSTHGPLLALAFLVIWYRILPVALQFVLCLCLYDSFLTIVDLQNSALLADLAISNGVRAKLTACSSFFSCVASASVFLSYMFWDRTDPRAFRLFCFALSLVAAVGFKVSCAILKEHFNSSHETTPKPNSRDALTPPHSDEGLVSKELRTYFRQLWSHKNFWWFTAMNLIQVFHCHFNSNFFPIFLDVLLGKRLSPTVSSFLLGMSFLMPHLNNLYLMHLCRLFGAYRVVRGLFVVKLLLSVLMWILGPNHAIALCLFIACNRIFTEGTCRLLNLVLTDLVDEDAVLHGRPQAVSALIFGTSSLLAKPGQTFAPLLGTWLLAWYTGSNMFASGVGSTPVQGFAGVPARATFFTSPLVQEACFWLLVRVPLICALLQLLTWSRFTLHGSQLRTIKLLRAAGAYGSKLLNV